MPRRKRKRKPRRRSKTRNKLPALLVLALGNPGKAYTTTRHNAGFMVADRIADRFKCTYRKPVFHRYLIAECGRAKRKLYLTKPLTYMNRSGEILDKVLRRTKCGISEMIVVCDNLDLPIGVCRMKMGGSSAGHNGLASVIHYAGSSDFMRLYIGIGRPRDGNIVDHVLGIPDAREQAAIETAVKSAASGVVALLDEPIERVMNEFNRRKT